MGNESGAFACHGCAGCGRELIYLLHGKEVGRTDLITAEAVEKANINTMLQRMLRQWF